MDNYLNILLPGIKALGPVDISWRATFPLLGPITSSVHFRPNFRTHHEHVMRFCCLITRNCRLAGTAWGRPLERESGLADPSGWWRLSAAEEGFLAAKHPGRGWPRRPNSLTTARPGVS